MDEGSQKAKSMFIKLAIVVVILLTLLCIGIFLLMSRLGGGFLNRQEDLNTAPTTTPIIGLTPTIIDFSSRWTKYIDRAYLYKFDIQQSWEIDYDAPEDDVLFIADDESSLGVRAVQHNYETVDDYVLSLDIENATANAGLPAVIVEWSNIYKIDQDAEVIRRKEKIVEDDKVVIRNYLMKEEYIFIFTTYSLTNETAETSEMFLEFLNVIGTFEYKTDRFEAEGTIVTGEGAGKPQCPDGYYLKIEGSYLRSSNSSLLLRSITPGDGNEYPLFQNRNLLGQSVKINAIYDTEKILCRGLSCDCEDYLLIESFE
ncbi:MAG TPA: hypothetical protein PKU78_03105 [Candidatus Dojkabacteria bacterium]|nr:hypothetical protein [Candidatus Dojkabacteria bacterium]HRO65183.1 hypothetical protein [Candidatus Dojkabacteria bacterium]HRP51172.1 hypothetical protein [Candidatus Dojkabacteria bacterium]